MSNKATWQNLKDTYTKAVSQFDKELATAVLSTAERNKLRQQRVDAQQGIHLCNLELKKLE